MVEEIKSLEKVIKLDKNEKIIRQDIKCLTAPGENYGSLMLSVDITVQGPTAKTLQLVAKLLPPNKILQEIFNTDVTYPKEVAFYEKIIPVLQKFQQEAGCKEVVHFAPKCYGSRLNMNNNFDKVDENAVLLLENLKIKGYSTPERTSGLSLQIAELILAELAQLHAVALGLKLKTPQVFQGLKAFLEPWKTSPNHLKKLVDDLTRICDQTDDLRPLKNEILKEFQQQMLVKEAREPFSTIVHNDCWTNNNMIKIEKGKPVENKIVDYQMYGYGSPAKDVIFFLFSSVAEDVLLGSYNQLLKFYHDKFIATLQELIGDVEEFSYEKFLDEIDYEAKHSQFAHIAFMLFVVYADQKNCKDVSEMDFKTLISEEISDLLKQKFVFFVNEFIKRKWVFNNYA